MDKTLNVALGNVCTKETTLWLKNIPNNIEKTVCGPVHILKGIQTFQFPIKKFLQFETSSGHAQNRKAASVPPLDKFIATVVTFNVTVR